MNFFYKYKEKNYIYNKSFLEVNTFLNQLIISRNFGQDIEA